MPPVLAPSPAKPDVPPAAEPAAPTVSIHPPQGEWTVELWAELPEDAPPCELADGCLELLPMTTNDHIRLQKRLERVLDAVAGEMRVFDNGPKLRVFEKTGRIPDVVVFAEELPPGDATAVEAATVLIAVEVLSPGRLQVHRDTVTKRAEYAAAGIAEYWIADLDAKTITQLRLPDGDEDRSYEEVAVHDASSTLTTPLLPQLSLPIGELFA